MYSDVVLVAVGVKFGGEDTRKRRERWQRSDPELRHGSHVAPEAADGVLSYCNRRCNAVAHRQTYELHKRMYERLILAFYYSYLMFDCAVCFSSDFSRNRLLAKVAAAMYHGRR